MGAFSALPLGRRPIKCRFLVVYRLDPRALAELLPAALEPRLIQGYAIATACYTRLGATPLFRGRDAGSDHLSYRFAVQRPDVGRRDHEAPRRRAHGVEQGGQRARAAGGDFHGIGGRGRSHLDGDGGSDGVRHVCSRS